MTFLHPHFFWLLLLIPFVIYFYFYRDKKNYSSILFSLPKKDNISNWKSKLYHLLFIFRVVTIVCIIISLARPQTTSVSTEILKRDGIDIIIAMDISESMLLEDFSPNRVSVAKDLAIDFIKSRKNDRIGLVVYSGQSFTQCPLTTDHDMLIDVMRRVEVGLVDGGTAIGLGLGNAVNRLKDSKAESKIIILLTDGENNTGFIDPITAADIARKYFIKTYTIGVSSVDGTAPFPIGKDILGNTIYQYYDVKLDEELLKSIADTTGGVYFRADNRKDLDAIYKEIDKLEKSEIEELKYFNTIEKYFLFTYLALVCFLLELILNYTIFKRII